MIVRGVPSEGERGSCPGRHFLGGGTFGVLWSFVRNVLLQIRFKCLAFAQKCRQNAGNAISETQISKLFWGSMPRTPLVGRALRRVRVPRLGAAYSSFSPGGKSPCYASVNSEYTYCDFLKTPGFTALLYAKVCDFCVIFYRVSSVNFGTITLNNKYIACTVYTY